MLVRDPPSLPTAKRINPADETDPGAGEIELTVFLSVNLLGQLLVEGPPGEDRLISKTNFLDLLKVEQSFAIAQGMQSRFPNQWLVFGLYGGRIGVHASFRG